MLTNEELQMQLDALQSKLYALEVENRKLREERPEQAELADLKDELKQVQEENVCLSQRVSELSTTQEEGTPGAAQPEVEELQRKLVRSEKEAAELKRQNAQQAEELGKEEQRYSQLHTMLEDDREVQRGLEEQLEQAAERVRRMQGEAELQMLRAVADETKKWEEREARWVQQLQTLENRGASPPTAALASANPTGTGYVASTHTHNVSGSKGSREKRVSFDNSNGGVIDSVGTSSEGGDSPSDKDRPTSVVVSTDNPQHCTEQDPGASVTTSPLSVYTCPSLCS